MKRIVFGVEWGEEEPVNDTVMVMGGMRRKKEDELDHPEDADDGHED